MRLGRGTFPACSVEVLDRIEPRGSLRASSVDSELAESPLHLTDSRLNNVQLRESHHCLQYLLRGSRNSFPQNVHPHCDPQLRLLRCPDGPIRDRKGAVCRLHCTSKICQDTCRFAHSGRRGARSLQSSDLGDFYITQVWCAGDSSIPEQLSTC
jgi:hypothetical protein